jgi:hypothetical protein
MSRAIRRIGSALAFSIGLSSMSLAATTIVVPVDLPALIDRVADQPERFAVNVPQQISASTDGQWTSNGTLKTWTLSTQVPTAISLSFHASRLALPASATLTVSGSRTTVVYRAKDINRGGLWGRPLVGDTLTFVLSFPAADAANVQVELDSLQAGYRGLGGLQSHPYFVHRMAIKAANTQTCVENYSCDATAANQGPAHAIVAILIGNQYQCTGTLLNDTRSDFTPYVLTARHCENGILGGGAPQAASSVAVYWDAVSPCGATLGSIYDSGTPVQFGATTMVEQQDAWLIQLDAAPQATDAYWAGWDATGAVFSGGYAVHHALGNNKQFVGWYGQAILQHIPGATLSVGYDSAFWGLVNELGSVGAGASGGALFDPNNRAVGSASLAALQDGANSTGVCPVTPLAAPTASTISAQYTALSAAFASNADATSTTSGVTLQSVLDAAGTGKLVVDGVGSLPITLTVDQSSPSTLQTANLSWNAPGAQTCTASGGVGGDGWAGTKAASGTASIADAPGGQVAYTLTCTGPGTKGMATVQVDWIYVAASISLNGPQTPLAIGGTVDLLWSSNVSPCVASGGIAGDGWAGTKSTNSGQQNVTASQVGNIRYTLTCGTSPRSASAQTTATVVPISVTMFADSTQVRVGSTVGLNWTSPGFVANCSSVGGSGTDHWAQQIYQSSPGSGLVVETTAGTYTYGIHCSGGGQTADSNVTVVFTNDAPAISLSAIAPTEQVYPMLPYQAATDLLWTANVTGCSIASIGPVGTTSVGLVGQYPNGTAADAEAIAGLYTYLLQCGGLQASTTIDWTNPNPTVALTAPTTTWAANYAYTVSWSSNTTPCTQTGGVSGDGWAVAPPGVVGQNTVAESQPGNYTFILTCGTGVSMSQAQLNVNVPTPAVSISADKSSVTVGEVVTLTWNSTIATCTSVDASGGVNWGGSNLTPSSYLPILEAAPGTYIYSITCGTGNQTVRASTTVTVEAPTPTTLSASTTSAVVNTPVTLTWNSSGAYPCTATFGNGGDGWTGTLNASGTATVTAANTGTLTYGINCGNDTAETQVAYVAPNATLSLAPTPTATLTSNESTQVSGQSITLTWSSKNATACTASGGTSGDGWTGTLAPSGSMQVVESNAVDATYLITCTGAPPAASAQAIVKYQAASGTGTASGGTTSGKSGGGGAFDAVTLLLLCVPLLIRLKRRPIVQSSRNKIG